MIDIGLMTKDEFLKFRNSKGKIHPNNAYDFDVMTLNQDYSLQTVFLDDRFEPLGYKPLTIETAHSLGIIGLVQHEPTVFDISASNESMDSLDVDQP